MLNRWKPVHYWRTLLALIYVGLDTRLATSKYNCGMFGLDYVWAKVFDSRRYAQSFNFKRDPCNLAFSEFGTRESCQDWFRVVNSSNI